MFISNYIFQNTENIEKIYEMNSNNYNFKKLHDFLLRYEGPTLLLFQ